MLYAIFRNAKLYFISNYVTIRFYERANIYQKDGEKYLKPTLSENIFVLLHLNLGTHLCR